MSVAAAILSECPAAPITEADAAAGQLRTGGERRHTSVAACSRRTSVGPARLVHRGGRAPPHRGLGNGALDQGQALMVGRMPCVIVRAEGEALFIVRGVGEQGAALARVMADFVPQDVADAG